MTRKRKPVQNGDESSIKPMLLSVPKAAIFMDVSEGTIWRMLAAQLLESVMVSGSRKIRLSEIERYLEENTISRAS